MSEGKTIEGVIASELQKMIESGAIEEAVTKRFNEMITSTVNDVMGKYGEVTKAIEKGLESTMLPIVESYDYSQHAVKLDAIMTEYIQTAAKENTKLSENLRIFLGEEIPEEIELSKIFKKYCEYVAANAKTDGLEVDFDDEPSYMANANAYFEMDDDNFGCMEDANITFTCDHDESMNAKFRLYRFSHDRESSWSLYNPQGGPLDLASIKNISEFNLLILKIRQSGSKIIIDESYQNDCFPLDEKPEISIG